MREAFLATDPDGGTPRVLLRCDARAAAGDAAAWLQTRDGEGWIELIAPEDRSAVDGLTGTSPIRIESWQVGIAHEHRVNDWRPYDAFALTSISGRIVDDAVPRLVAGADARPEWREPPSTMPQSATEFGDHCRRTFAAQPWTSLMAVEASDEARPIAWIDDGGAIISESDAARRAAAHDDRLALLARFVDPLSGADHAYLTVPVRLIGERDMEIRCDAGIWNGTSRRRWMARAVAIPPVAERAAIAVLPQVAIVRVSPHSRFDSGRWTLSVGDAGITGGAGTGNAWIHPRSGTCQSDGALAAAECALFVLQSALECAR